MVGNTGAGKTSLLYSLLGFAERELDHPPTLGVQAYNYGNYVIWDMAGNPSLCVGKGLFYHSAQIGVVVHGGEEYLAPQEWELDLKQAMGQGVQIYHVQGTLQEKLEQLKAILI